MDREKQNDELPGLPRLSGLDHGGGESHLLREIMRTYQTLVGSFSRRVGMPAAQLTLLRLLAGCGPEGLGILDIARRLDVNAAAVTRQVKGIEAQGLIARRSDPMDGRRSFVRLTDAGRSTFEQIHARGHDLEREATATLSEEDLATTKRVLHQIRTALDPRHRSVKES